MIIARHDDTPYKGSYWWYVWALGISVVVFAAATLIARSGKAQGWEQSIFVAINGWPEWLYRPAAIITFLGSTWMGALSVVAAFLTRYYRLAWRLAISIVGGYGTAFLAKHFIDRARPEGLFSDVHARIAETGAGFPSGHATCITILTLSILPYLPYKLRWTLPVLVLLVVLSRLYLGVHVPLDIIGGMALGTAVVSFIRILPQSLRILVRVD